MVKKNLIEKKVLGKIFMMYDKNRIVTKDPTVSFSFNIMKIFPKNQFLKFLIGFSSDGKKKFFSSFK